MKIEHAKDLFTIATTAEEKQDYGEAHTFFIQTTEVLMELLKLTVDDADFQKALKDKVSFVFAMAEVNKNTLATNPPKPPPREEEKTRPRILKSKDPKEEEKKQINVPLPKSPAIKPQEEEKKRPFLRGGSNPADRR